MNTNRHECFLEQRKTRNTQKGNGYEDISG